MSEIPEQPPDTTPEEGVSLRGLSEAFAQALGVQAESEDTATPVETESQADEGQAPDERQPEPANRTEVERAACPVSPKTILEAMLFVGNHDNQPLESRQAAELMRGVEPAEIPGLVDELNRQYADAGCPYHIASEGSGYRMRLRKSFEPLRNRFYGRVREARLSQAAIDVLAILAYQQPLTSDQVSRLRDKPSGPLLTQLVRRRLVRVERPEGKPRKTFYRTTDRFLKLFGLESLDDLPQSEELDESPLD